MVTNDSYNPKIDYLFCKYLLTEHFDIDDEQLWKNVYNESITPTNKSQEVMLVGKQILDYIKREDTFFSFEAISNIFSRLAGKELELPNDNEIRLSEIIDQYHENIGADFAANVFINILKEQLFIAEWNREMAKIIHNFIQIKRGLVPAVFYRYQIYKVEELIKQNEVDGALMEMKNIYFKTHHFNTKHRIVSFEEIKTRIGELENKLKNEFGIEELYLFGSYAVNKQNEYSDLDVFAKVSKTTKSDPDNRFRIFSFLEKELGIGVDGQIASSSIINNQLRTDMKRHLLRIF